MKSKTKFLVMFMTCFALALPSFAAEKAENTVKENSINIFFDVDSSILSDSSVEALEDMVAKAKKAKLVVLIFGNCDKTGSRLYNLELGDRRAKAVRDQLKEFGIEDFQIFTSSYGEEKPVAPNDKLPAHLQYNRRAEVIPLILASERLKNRVLLYGGVGPFLLNKQVIDPMKEYKIKQAYNAVFGLGYSRSMTERWSLGLSAFSNFTFLLNVGFDF